MKKTKIISAVIGAVLLSSSILSCEKLKSSFNKESSDETQEELEAARAEAEAAKQEAEEAKKAAEAAKKDAEKARKAADAAKKETDSVKAEAAKKEADSVKIVDSAWDFEKGEKASKNQTILSFGNDKGVKPKESDITIQSDSGSGAKLVFVKQDAVPIKYNKGLQLSSVKAEGKVAIITVGKDCNLIITARGSTSIDSFNPATKLNSFSVNGKNIYKRTIADDNKIQTWKVQLKKGDNTISASGMKFISLVCE